MAEVLAALGLAANVIQFVDFGSSLTIKLWSLYRADRENVEALLDVETITRDLQKITAGLSGPSKLNSLDDKGLMRLAADCQAVATELLSLLVTLNGPKGKQRGKLEAMKSALRHIWKEADIDALRSRLDGFRSQISVHLLASLRSVASRPLRPPPFGHRLTNV